MLIGPRGKLLAGVFGLKARCVEREVHAEVTLAGTDGVVVFVRTDRPLSPVCERDVGVGRLVLIGVDRRPRHVVAVRTLEVADRASHQHRRQGRITDLRGGNLAGKLDIEQVAAASERHGTRDGGGPSG